jgi:hypothetical protein
MRVISSSLLESLLIHPFQECEVSVHFVPNLKNSKYYMKTFVTIVCLSLESLG